MVKQKPKLRILILTQHEKHSIHNSLYGIARAIQKQEQVASVHVASRSIKQNNDFFQAKSYELHTTAAINQEFTHENTRENSVWKTNKTQVSKNNFDIIFLRLPPPITKEFAEFLESIFPKKQIINTPTAIRQVGSKEYLTKCKEFTYPTKLIKTQEELQTFLNKHEDVVLKPLRDYGGKGIVRITKDHIHIKSEPEQYQHLKNIESHFPKYPFIAMKFLKGVIKGDKRIIVVNGKVIASIMRRPQKGNWLCNVAQGGQDGKTRITRREIEMVESLTPKFKQKGIIVYALDTLEDENKRRYLSEINCTSVGGTVPAEKLYKKELASLFAKHLIKHCTEILNNNKKTKEL